MKRRDFVKTVAVGAGAVAAGLPLGDAVAAHAARDGSLPADGDHAVLLSTGQVVPARLAEVPPTAPPPAWLFAPLAVGEAVYGDWRLEAISPVRFGGFTLTLADGFESARVNVCAVGTSGPRGVAHTETLDLLVANAGHGARATDESLAVAVHALAAAARRNEAAGVDALGLASFEERVRTWGEGVLL